MYKIPWKEGWWRATRCEGTDKGVTCPTTEAGFGEQAFETAWRDRQALERREEQHGGMAHSQWEEARLYRDTCNLRIKRGEQYLRWGFSNCSQIPLYFRKVSSQSRGSAHRQKETKSKFGGRNRLREGG